MTQPEVRMCPFQCGGKMVNLRGDAGPKLLFKELLDTNSGMIGMLSGALNRHPRGRYEQCNTCNFLAIFPSDGR